MQRCDSPFTFSFDPFVYLFQKLFDINLFEISDIIRNLYSFTHFITHKK